MCKTFLLLSSCPIIGVCPFCSNTTSGWFNYQFSLGKFMVLDAMMSSTRHAFCIEDTKFLLLKPSLNFSRKISSHSDVQRLLNTNIKTHDNDQEHNLQHILMPCTEPCNNRHVSVAVKNTSTGSHTQILEEIRASLAGINSLTFANCLLILGHRFVNGNILCSLAAPRLWSKLDPSQTCLKCKIVNVQHKVLIPWSLGAKASIP